MSDQDLNPAQWSKWAASTGAKPVDLGTVPCGICGERVRVGMNGMWSEYHDCKPVPLARLQQAERERDEARHERDEARAGRAEWEAVAIKYLPYKRERDEARAALAVERQHRDGHLPSCAGIDREEGRCGCGYLDGTAYRDMTARMEQATALLREAKRCVYGDDANRIAREINAFLAGQPAPVKVVVNDAMVERAMEQWVRTDRNAVLGHRALMRAALVAALEGEQ